MVYTDVVEPAYKERSKDAHRDTDFLILLQ